MAELFRLTDLEVRIGVNMNVLVDGTTPRVLDLKELLRAWLAHRREVLRRRSLHRHARIEQRLELLGGFLVVHLNLDEVIRIVREEDDPKQALMRRFSLTETQADAVLNMRLRQLRKLEEIELRREQESLLAERAGLDALLGSDALMWRRIADEVRATGERFGASTELGRRRTLIAGAPGPVAAPVARTSPGATDHRALLREGLAEGRARASRRCVRCPIQGGRPGPLRPARALDRPDPDFRRRRPLLHARPATGCRPAAASANRCG